jgi:signal transduction histidine kinase
MSEGSPSPHSPRPDSSADNLSREASVQSSRMDSALLERLVQSLPAVTYGFRLSDKKLLFLSDNVRTLFGFDPNRLLMQPAAHLEQIHPHDQARVCEQLGTMVGNRRHEQGHEIEYRIQAGDGTFRTVLHHLQFVTDETGQPVECFGCCLDITRQREREWKDARRMEDVESAMRMITHDLRAPLRALHGFAQALQDDYGPQLGEEGKQFTDYIVDAARQMDQMTIDLLTYTRVGRRDLRIVPVDLGRILREVQNRLRRQIEDRRARIVVSSELPSLKGNNETLQHVMEHLIANAIQFSLPDQSPEIHIRTERHDRCWRVWVEDNGIGIAPEDQERIFELLERLHGVETYPGNGIGLAIVRRGVRNLGGECGVESTLGEGSRFWIELPADN